MGSRRPIREHLRRPPWLVQEAAAAGASSCCASCAGTSPSPQEAYRLPQDQVEVQVVYRRVRHAAYHLLPHQPSQQATGQCHFRLLQFIDECCGLSGAGIRVPADERSQAATLEQLLQSLLLFLRLLGFGQLMMRRYPHRVEAGATGGEVVRRGHLDRAFIEVAYLLHRSLAVGLLAEQVGTSTLAQRRRQDLRRGRRAAVDQHHDGQIGVHQRGVLRGAMDLVLGFHARPGGDDHSRGKKEVGHLHHRGEQPAGIAAQVDDQSCGTAELPQGLRHPFRCEPGELADAQVADGIVDERVPYGDDFDHGTFDGHFEGDGVVAPERDRHGRAGRSPQAGDDVADCELHGRLSVDGHDHVAGAYSRAMRRQALDRRNHLHAAVAVRRHVHAHAAELAPRQVGDFRDLVGTNVR